MSAHGRAPRLSVTVLNYNYARYLPGCIESILRQTFADFELIVIDDRSTDGSVEAVQPYLGDPRVRLVAHEKNAGYVASLIEATETHSRGAHVMVISADDYVARDDAFERQVAMMERHPEATFCFSGFERLFVDGGGAEAHASFADDRALDGREAFECLLIDNGVQVLHSGAMTRRSAYDDAGGYGRELRYAPDTDLWLRLALRGSVAYCAQPLYGYRIHRGQMSGVAAHRAQTVETLSVIDGACGEAARLGMDIRDLRRRGTEAYLFGAAIDEAFRGSRRAALLRAWVALTLRPRVALTSRSLPVVLLRCALGGAGFGAMRAIARAAPWSRAEPVARAAPGR